MTPSNWLRGKVQQLFQIKDTPHAVALGVAVGIFFGFVPLVGLKTLLALGVTRLLRGNLLAAAIAVTLHDVSLPGAPLLLRWEYDLGYWLLSHPHGLPPHLQLHELHASAWLHWSTFLTVGRPLLLGSILLAAPVSVLAYYVTLTWSKWRHSRVAHQE
jgi:uncharacterized protein (DUF2062 family)